MRTPPLCRATPYALRHAAALDTSRVLLLPLAHLPSNSAEGEYQAAWEASLRNRFVTGDWDSGQARAAARPEQDAEVCGVVFGVCGRELWAAG